MKKNIWRSLAAVVLVAVMVALSVRSVDIRVEAATSTPVATHGRLSVKGPDIVDAKGRKFQLRGISTHGINWDVGYPFVNKEAFKTLRDDWGANAIRLSMYTAEYNGYCSGGDKAALRNRIYKGVKYATELGMYVIIDWHILNDGNPLSQVTQAKYFFATMAKKYYKQKNIIYEICNEPNGCSWKDIKSYANQVIKVIRKYDKNAIIAVGTPTWSQLGSDGTHNEVADSPITGYKNIMYSLHFYANEWSHNKYLPAKLAYARKRGVPVIVTEFGMSAASGDGGISVENTKKWMTRLNNANVSYFCWSLSNKNESCSLLASTTKKTYGWTKSQLSLTGRYIRYFYRARRKALGARA